MKGLDNLNGFYWENQSLKDFNVIDCPEFQKYLDFLSMGEVDRNIEMLDRAQERGGWSELSHFLNNELGYDVSPNTLQFKAYDMKQKNILNERNEWTEASRDVVEAYNFYGDQCDNLTELLGASKSKGSLAMFEIYDEGDEFSVRELSQESGLHYSYFLQTALPKMREAELIEINDISTSGIGHTKPPYNIVGEFMGSLEAIMDKHY